MINPQTLRKYFHATSPENCASILRGEFDDRTDSGHVSMPGVWLGEVPALSGLGVDFSLGNIDESWLEVEMPSDVFDQYEVFDLTWHCRQAKIPAEIVNQCPVRELSLQEVIQIRRRMEGHYFLDAFLEAVDSMSPDLCLIRYRETREWYSSAFGGNRLIERVEHSSGSRERVLHILKALADCVSTEEYHRIVKTRVEQLFSMECRKTPCQCHD